MKIFGIIENEEVCANCKYYLQHYVRVHGIFSECNAGHCIYPRIKDRKPNSTCEHFEKGEYK